MLLTNPDPNADDFKVYITENELGNVFLHWNAYCTNGIMDLDKFELFLIGLQSKIADAKIKFESGTGRKLEPQNTEGNENEIDIL